MSSSPTFILDPTSGVEEEEMLAIAQGRSHTSPPRSRPNSRLEILIMDMARSTEQRLENLARSQAEQSQSTLEQIDEITRGCTEQLAHITGRLSSLEVTRHGTPSPSPNPGRRGSPSSAETMHVSVPSTNGDLVPLPQAEVRRSERLMLKSRPDYRLLNRSATRQDKSITAIEEDAEYDDPTPIWRRTTSNPIAGEMTFRHGPGDIEGREIIREGQDIVIESRIVGPEVNLDLAKKPLRPPVTSFGVAPEVEGSVRGKDVRRSRMARTLTDTDRGRNNGDEDGIYSYFRSDPRDENVDEADNSHVRFRPRINDGNNDDTTTPFVQSSSRANMDDNEVPTSYFRSRPDNVNIDRLTEFRFRPVVTDRQTVEVVRSGPVEFHELRRPTTDRRTDNMDHDNGRITVPGHFELRKSMINWGEGEVSRAITRERLEAYTAANSVSVDRGAIDRQRATIEAGASRQWNAPPLLESVMVTSATRDHQRAREQPLMPYDSTFFPSHFATDNVSHLPLPGGQPSLLQSSAKLYDPGLSTRPGYASYPGFNLNADRSRPPAQLSSSAPSVSVATQTVPVVVTSALPIDVSNGASEAKATPTAPTTSSATTSMKSGSYIKLGQFSGRGPVLPFLKRFEVCRQQNQWSASDSLNHLMCALTDTAGQLVWEEDNDEIGTAEELVKRLKDRFGSENEQALYRVRLSSRRQGPMEDLGTLVSDIRKFMTLAYPGKTTTHSEAFAVQSYIRALLDRSLALSVAEREPKDLQQAYQISLRLQAFRQADADGNREANRNKLRVNTIREAEQSPEDETRKLERRIRELEKAGRPKPLGIHRPHRMHTLRHPHLSGPGTRRRRHHRTTTPP